MNSTGNHQILHCPFKFEAMWTKDPRSHLVVKNASHKVIHYRPTARWCRRINSTKHALKR
ncbi:hypothetical protein PanWU01x14_334620 [Parasponia andersonii]|uniref:Uncharacterized protein n=1 Tax=Parasponia andersonii TaxID=3476 RepID=A0A2P5AGG4_PARAD|nr:hypothetical protein PanWU01x14_334620 [Parasponia andersonii]